MAARAFPILLVRELRNSTTFYERLGFAETYRQPATGDAVFVTLERDGDSIGLAVGDPGMPSERFAYWVYVDDVDAVTADLEALGASVDGQPRNEEWGERVAHVRDPDGNVVHLGQEL